MRCGANRRRTVASDVEEVAEGAREVERGVGRERLREPVGQEELVLADRLEHEPVEHWQQEHTAEREPPDVQHVRDDQKLRHTGSQVHSYSMIYPV